MESRQAKIKKGRTDRKKFLWIGLAAVVILLGASAYIFTTGAAFTAQAATATPAYHTTTVRQGDIRVDASGVGTLTASTQADLSFSAAGTVEQQLGITPQPGGFGNFGTPNPELDATRQARIAQGGGNFQPGDGAGGPGGGQGFIPGGGTQGQNTGQVATAIAGRRANGGGMNSALLDALINLLTQRAG